MQYIRFVSKLVLMSLYILVSLSAKAEVVVDFDVLPYAEDYYTLTAQEVEKRAHAGDPFAQSLLHHFYGLGSNGYPYDSDEGNKWRDKAFSGYEQLAEKGNAAAQYAVALFYADEENPNKDIDKASKYLTKSAEQGYALAQYRLGYMYKYGYINFGGERTEKNPDLSEYWYKKAFPGVVQGANEGKPTFQKLLSIMYSSGRGVQKNEEQAQHWARKSIESYRGAVVIDDKKIFSLMPIKALLNNYIIPYSFDADESTLLFKAYALTELWKRNTHPDPSAVAIRSYQDAILEQAVHMKINKAALDAFSQKCMEKWTQECY